MSRVMLGEKHGPESMDENYSGTVYDRPNSSFPFIAVIFDPDGEVVIARSVPSFEIGEEFIRQTLEGFVPRKTGLNNADRS
jgi:hypothetical protein